MQVKILMTTINKSVKANHAFGDATPINSIRWERLFSFGYNFSCFFDYYS